MKMYCIYTVVIVIGLGINVIECRSFESTKEPIIIPIATTTTPISNNGPDNITTATEQVLSGTIFPSTPRTFDICEEFGIENGIDRLGMQNRGVTVVIKLF